MSQNRRPPDPCLPDRRAESVTCAVAVDNLLLENFPIHGLLGRFFSQAQSARRTLHACNRDCFSGAQREGKR